MSRRGDDVRKYILALIDPSTDEPSEKPWTVKRVYTLDGGEISGKLEHVGRTRIFFKNEKGETTSVKFDDIAEVEIDEVDE